MRRALPPDRLAGLADPLAGLTSAAVEARRRTYGANIIVEQRSGGWIAVLKDSARDPMIGFLIVTAALFLAVGDRAEAVVLALAIFPLAGMDAYLHRRTQASTEGLASRLAATATVLRGGVESVVPALDVVVGDLVRVAAGESFPADGLLLAGAEMQVDESALTGESMPVRKRPLAAGALARASSGIEGMHWGLAGTRLLTGQARCVVTATGVETLYGEIVRSARVEGRARTPLQIAISGLVKILLGAALAACVALAAIRVWQGFGWLDALISAVTLAVAAIPEEFPVVFTFYLGVGVHRLARCQALVRRGVVVENIGRVSCICSDKTGTLTEGRLRVAHLVAADPLPELRVLALAAAASRQEGADPVDVALLDAAAEARITAPQRLETYPYTEERRRETAILREAESGVFAAVKGAPEAVLAMTTLAPGDAQGWLRRVEEMAAAGHKVLACAWREIEAVPGSEPTSGFTLAGLVALEDPLRPGVAEALDRCRQAGIRVVMVTGDHPVTARAIAAEIRLGGSEPLVLEGSALDADGTTADLDRVDIVARATPGHKLRLVRHFQARGHVVAVTGDGVNDVPALQAADVGIAMGERATRSAREAASIVLLDDNLRTIVGAVAEGRQLFHNLRRSFAYLLMLHIPLVASAAIIPFAGFPLLYLPIHIVWLELILHPTALLAFQDPASGNALSRPTDRHRAGRLRFFSRREWGVIAGTGLLITLVVLIAYLHALADGSRAEHARALALMGLITAGATLTVALSSRRAPTARWIAALSLASALALMQVPFAAARLHLEPLHRGDLVLTLLLGALAGAPALAFRARPRS